MAKLKALGGIIIGCILMVIVGVILYKLNTVAYATGLLGAVVAVLLGNVFSKGETPVFTAVMAAILCLGTAYGVSVYCPAKDLTEGFDELVADEKSYRVDFLDLYAEDPQFGLEYAQETDPEYYIVYEDWSYLTNDLNGDVDAFNDWFDEEYVKPYEDRSQISYWFAHPDQLMDKDDEFIGGGNVHKTFIKLLIFNSLGVIVSIIGLIGSAMKRR
jgi:hypothetical protein